MAERRRIINAERLHNNTKKVTWLELKINALICQYRKIGSYIYVLAAILLNPNFAVEIWVKQHSKQVKKPNNIKIE